MRTIIELSDDLAADLDRFCKAQNITRIACIRQAIRDYLDAHAGPAEIPAEHFGSWANRPGDSLVIESAYREEW